MSLYIAGDEDVNDIKDVVAVVANSKDEFIGKLVDQVYAEEFEIYSEDRYLDDFLDDVKGNEMAVFSYAAIGDIETFKKRVFYFTDLKYYEYKEFDMEKDLKPFIAAHKDLEKLNDVMVVFANSADEATVKAIDIYTEDEIHDSIFREHIIEKAVNFSVNTMFWNVDGHYAFNQYCGSDKVYNPHVYIKYRGKSEEEIHKLVDQEYRKNVLKFFADSDKDYGQQYIDYIFGDYEPNFEDDFYRYFCKKLCLAGEWAEFDVMPVELPSEVSI
ncbi:hypothetical protein [Radiobacillus sp. PE A8.2]|uniref:hypothetical protein n=1 Tax=Radiobacillus sp. PE A8.2 TaxID=3380349 RepID=UPI00388CEE4B